MYTHPTGHKYQKDSYLRGALDANINFNANRRIGQELMSLPPEAHPDKSAGNPRTQT